MDFGSIMTLCCFFICLTIWDIVRRNLADGKHAREFRAELSTKLLQELADTQRGLQELDEHLRSRQEVAEKALANFIAQAQALINTLEKKRQEAVNKNVRGAM